MVLPLPSKWGGAKYTPVEYISSTGTQYINTGYVPTPNTRVVIDAEVTSQTTASCSYFGERSGSGATDKTAYEIWSMGTAANVSSDFFGNRVSYTISTKQRLLIDKNKATVTINGNTVTNSAAAGTATIPAYLFASNDKGTAAYFINMKLYSCKIYENDVLVRDYIPAKDEWGNAGLWDDVESKFYYNAGTDSFKAPNIRMIGSVGVGQSVYCNVNNVKTEFIIVHQGKPSSLYDDSCDGTWLLMKDIYGNFTWDATGRTIYSDSGVHSYLNSTLLNLVDIKDVIKQVKIPHGNGGSDVLSGTNGLSTKIFLLAGYEVGFGGISHVPEDGAKLSYFDSGTGTYANNKRVATLNGSAFVWWLRSAHTTEHRDVWDVNTDGMDRYDLATKSLGVRPAFILPSDAYIDENNNIFTSSPYKAISTLNVGDSVFCKEDGVDAEYLLVHKGNPDATMYDASCDGAWLLRKDVYENRVWDSEDINKYESSDINTYLNNTFLNLFDSNIKDTIKQVKIPYRKNGGDGGTDQSGANGLSAKVFLLSGYEVGLTTSDNQFPVDGAKLSYFESGIDTSANNKRIANLNGSAARWWLRSPNTASDVSVWYVLSNGGRDYNNAYNSGGIRPAFIVPLDTFIDSSNNIIA